MIIRHATRTVDTLVAAGTLLVALFMSARTHTRGTSFVFPSPAAAIAAFIALALFVAIALLLVERVRRVPLRWAMRAIIYVLAATFVIPSVGRIRNRASDFVAWPPKMPDTRVPLFSNLYPDQRALWALRIVTHIMESQPASAHLPTVPADWPVPPDVAVAVRVNAAGETEVWASADSLPTPCVMILTSHAGAAYGIPEGSECQTKRQPPDRTSFHPVVRSAPVAAVSSPPPNVAQASEGWSQYRADAAKSAAITGISSAAHAWSARVDGEVRSTPAASGDVAFVGAHGTGALGAFEISTGRERWHARAPNWIHQDPVTDGSVVIVGFGENSHWIPLIAPAGVAAYDVATGASLWTAFDESTVMTSPVISGAMLLYISEGGILRKRELRTGRLIAQMELPGSAVMGPPAASGDTLVVALENDVACSVRMTPFIRDWCATLPGLRLAGHTAATIAADRVLLSGFVPLSSGWRTQLLTTSPWVTAKLLWRMSHGTATIGGQQFRAIDRRDGHELWRSAIYPAHKLAGGHISGTPALMGTLGVVVLPLADTLIAFNSGTGATVWAAPAHGSRGPPLIVDGHVVLTGTDGWIEIRDLVTGLRSCTIHRAVGYDRAGPTLAGGMIILANVAGTVEAVPLHDFLECRGFPAETHRSVKEDHA